MRPGRCRARQGNKADTMPEARRWKIVQVPRNTETVIEVCNAEGGLHNSREGPRCNSELKFLGGTGESYPRGSISPPTGRVWPTFGVCVSTRRILRLGAGMDVAVHVCFARWPWQLCGEAIDGCPSKDCCQVRDESCAARGSCFFQTGQHSDGPAWQTASRLLLTSPFLVFWTMGFGLCGQRVRHTSPSC